jgi:5'-3' exonuclease
MFLPVPSLAAPPELHSCTAYFGVDKCPLLGNSSNMDAAAKLKAQMKKRHRGASDMVATDKPAEPASKLEKTKEGEDAAAALWKAEASAEKDAGVGRPVDSKDNAIPGGEDDDSKSMLEPKCTKLVNGSASADNKEYKAKLQDILKSKSDLFEDMLEGEEQIRLGDHGWKGRYYEQKFGISEEPEQARLIVDLRRAYVEGLCWVMRYYFDGVASWRWFYPFHYAPFASDLEGMSALKVRAR